MLEYLSVLTACPLFRGIPAEGLSPLLSALEARTADYPRAGAVLRAGEEAHELGVVLDGQVQVCREDSAGNRSILARLEPGELFGEAYACAGAVRPAAVYAATDCAVLLLDCRRIFPLSSAACGRQDVLVANLMSILARKNILLSEKIEHLSKRTLREKLLSYLRARAAAEGRDTFTIPFDRQELADYLCADRSALSRELGKLRREGVLSCRRSTFTLR